MAGSAVRRPGLNANPEVLAWSGQRLDVASAQCLLSTFFGMYIVLQNTVLGVYRERRAVREHLYPRAWTHWTVDSSSFSDAAAIFPPAQASRCPSCCGGSDRRMEYRMCNSRTQAGAAGTVTTR